MQRITSGSPFEKTMGYSRAVVKGPWCFVSGTTGYDYTTMEMPVSIADQARNCFKTIEAALIEGGFAMTDIVRVQYTVTDTALVFGVLVFALDEVHGQVVIGEALDLQRDAHTERGGGTEVVVELHAENTL